MSFSRDHLDSRLAGLDGELAALRAAVWGDVGSAIDRLRGDIAAIRFHLSGGGVVPIVAVLGGTGTGKSTLVNRLLSADVSATSFRRTFTSGAVCIAADAARVPANWLGVEHRGSMQTPARGLPGALTVVTLDHPLTQRLTLVDTPDLDGDQPAHHAEADRAFRWAQGLVFLVTPEKYQMTELLPYYRLAQRYGLPAIFVMNKCEENAVLEDYRVQLASRQWNDAAIYALPRDDAGWEPPPQGGIEALRQSLPALNGSLARPDQGIRNRLADLLDRVRDQVIGTLRQQRAEIARLLPAMRLLEGRGDVNVGPFTRQLEQRMQEQSVLYLMGPQRIWQRMKQAPTLLVRLPRTMWSVVRGRGLSLPSQASPADPTGPAPDFARILTDQFTILQSRLDDLLRSSPSGQRWLHDAAEDYRAAKVDPALAGRIAQEELDELRHWLEQKWEKTPRDTLLLQKLLRFLPGGRKLVEWSEAAPYLLALVVATHHAFLGPIDLLVIGGFSLATWLGEKLSNEVTGRTRQTNRRIESRFDQLVSEQIERLCAWVERQSPPADAIERLSRWAEALHQATEE